MVIAAARNVSRVYSARRGVPEIRALDAFSLSLEAGEYVALLGPNGAGKSTLLRLFAGLDAPTSGDVVSVARAELGVVFQKPALDALLTVRENLCLQAALHGLKGRAARAEESAAVFGLTDRLDSRAGELSGGLARRADLARALLTKPSLLLLDEPTTGLDHRARAGFLDAIDAQREASAGLAVVMSTHLMDEAARASRVVLISGGRLIADGTPDELRSSLGGSMILRTAEDNTPLLERYRLSVVTHARVASATGEADAVTAAAEGLLHAGFPFELAPPTLGDVYLTATGESLEGAAS